MSKILKPEIEARFIVSIRPEEQEPKKLRQMYINQRYLRGKGRIRKMETTVTGQDTETTTVILNRKWKMPKTLGGNWELELRLPNTFFIAKFCFWFLTKFFSDPTCHPIYKIRSVYEWIDGMELEWDVFANQYALPNGPFGMLEVEVSEGFDLATIQSKLPRWFEVEKDVTGQEYWSNASISRKLHMIYHRRGWGF